MSAHQSSPLRRAVSRRARVVGVVGLLAALTLAAPVASATTRPRAHEAVPVPVAVSVGSAAAFSAVSCARPIDCTAVGTLASTSTPFVDVETNGVWAPPATLTVTGGGSLAGISCSDPDDCTAVGESADADGEPLVLTESSGVWSAAVLSSPDTAYFSAVSCVEAGVCTAVGVSGGYAATADESAGTWSSLESAQGAGSGTGFTAVSCATADDCTAVGSTATAGLVDTETSGTWLDAEALTGTTSLAAVSCWSASNCVAVGSDGSPVAIPLSDGVWGSVSALSSGAGGLRGVSCAGATVCTAVGASNSQPTLATRAGGSWSALHTVAVPSPGAFTALSCDEGNCLAVGADGDAGSTAIYDVVSSRVASSPRNVSVVPLPRKLKVSWSPPASHGGGPIASYTATASPGGDSCTTAARSCVIHGLTNDTGYVVRVTAANGFGNSAPGTSSVLTFPVANTRFISVPTVPVVLEKGTFRILISGVRHGTVVAIQVSDTKRHCATDTVGQCSVTASIKTVGEYPVIATYGRGSSVAVGIFGVIDVASLTLSSHHVPHGRRVLVSVTSGLPKSVFTASLSGGPAVSRTLGKSGAGELAVPTPTVGTQTLVVQDDGVTLASYPVVVTGA